MTTRSWKDRIPDCFDFGTAGFAVHPCDEERAQKMLREAICEGATWPKVRREIRKYLANQKISRADIGRELKRVESFRPNPFLKRSLKRAWLTTLEEEPAPSESPLEVVSILNYRISPTTVRWLVEQSYIERFYNGLAKLSVARNKHENAFLAEFVSSVPGCRIVCGYGPYLIARPVRNLRFEGAEMQSQRLRWDEISPPVGAEIVWPRPAQL